MSASAVADAAPRPARGGRPGPLARLARNRLAALGLAVVAAIVLTALAAPILPLPDPDVTNLAARNRPPFSPDHLLGTDQLGRDLLSRLIWGTRVSLAVAAAATLAAAGIGTLIGLVAGYYGRWVDNALMRGVDMLLAFPYVLLALAIVAALGPGLMNALIAVSIVNIPFFARAVRGVTLGVAQRDYVDAARLSGASDVKILASEILPNAAPSIIVAMSTTFGWMILETAGLSFLGLGAQPPQADLGSMLGDGRDLLLTSPHVATLPGLMVFVLVIAINLLGDGLRDVLDPRLKTGVAGRPAAATRVAPDAAAKNGEEPPVTAPAAEPALRVRNLRAWFRVGGRVLKAVDDVSFDVARGECLGVVGESGSGKSAMALSLMRLTPTPPCEIVGGQVFLGDEDVLQVAPERLRELRGGRVAYVFQDPLTTLNPLMRVGDQIAEAVRRPGLGDAERRARAVELMDMVRIPNARGRARAYPHELSGGMRQRISIAMALANDPDVIVADEPTTALDVTIQAQVLKLLDELRRSQGAALIFISHDFGVVSEICDRVMVMYAGRAVEIGPTDAVLQAPRHPYARRLISCAPRLGEPERALDAIPGLPPGVDALPPGCAFAERCDMAVEACRSGTIALDPVGAARWSRCIRAPGEETRP